MSRQFGDDPTVVLHVPHGGLRIPADVRSAIVLDDGQLEAELAAMTDRHTDHLAVSACERSATSTVVVANELSRLVVDPERFVDERESMAEIGMGRVYLATSTLDVLRHPDPQRDADLVRRYFEPYETAVARAVDVVLDANGHATILDIHSYPRDPLPYERDHGAERPGICLGTDGVHTPRSLLDAAREVFDGVPGGVALDTPFAGTYVPGDHYGTNTAVRSLMVEIRRDLYMDETTLELHGGADDVTARLAALIDRS
ncbi:N-formylglutamate amidohydrolase [Actinomarinicola tropica]|uniref:N-formylglutamate amidohydrolase n=1 Tax=Actinomarinicola tropica TaxID=2789776 RepID=A0A5Q2RK02_9ACTN|nr:N-formylglutamate amidohydrolase [Actinomarinicola tropica]